MRPSRADPAQLTTRLRSSVVKIATVGEDEPPGVATGFLIDGAPVIVTSAGAVAGLTGVRVRARTGPWIDAMVLPVSDDVGLALVRVPSGLHLEPLDLGASSDLEPGDPVYTLGFRAAEDAEPVCSSYRFTGDMTRTSVGEVGAPLMDRSGAIVGVHRTADSAIPVEDLRRWLRATGLGTGARFVPRSTPDSFFAVVRDSDVYPFDRAYMADDADVIGPLTIKERRTTDGTEGGGQPRLHEAFRVGLNVIEWSTATPPTADDPPAGPSDEPESTEPGLV